MGRATVAGLQAGQNPVASTWKWQSTKGEEEDDGHVEPNTISPPPLMLLVLVIATLSGSSGCGCWASHGLRPLPDEANCSITDLQR